MEIVLLKCGKEKRLVLTDGPAGCEAENVDAENRLRSSVQPVKIGNRVKALRLIPPKQSAMEIVGSGLRHQVEHAAASAAEFYSEIAGLNRNLHHRISDGEDLFLAADPNLVVLRPVQHVVVSPGALAVDGEPSSVIDPSGAPSAAPNSAARGFGRAGQGTSQRKRI